MTINYHHLWTRSVNTLTPQNRRTHSYDQTGKEIVNLGSNKGDKNNDSYPKLNFQNNSLLTIIVDTTEKCLYHGEAKSVTRKVHKSSVNPY